MSSFAENRWTGPRQKADVPSRVDERLEKEAEAASNERRWNKEIDLRDGKQCRVCDRKSDPERVGLTTRGHRAHIVYASAGGSMAPHNRVTLCAACHSDEHRDRLRFTADGGPYAGIDANQGMTFWRKDKDGRWYVVREEIAVRVVRKD